MEIEHMFARIRRNIERSRRIITDERDPYEKEKEHYR